MLESVDSIRKRAENAGLQRATLDKKKEKDAVLNLLDFQQQQQPIKPAKPAQGDNGNNGKSKKAKAKVPGLKPPPIYPPKSKKRPRPTLEDLLRAQATIKPPPPAIIPKVFLMDMGKKRKRHRTVSGQFENNQEDEELIRSSPKNGLNAKNPAASPASNYQLLLEQQAQERRRSLERITASRLKKQLFSVFTPDDVNAERSDPSNDKSDGGIYDDPEMPDETKTLTAGNIPTPIPLSFSRFGGNIPKPTQATPPTTSGFGCNIPAPTQPTASRNDGSVPEQPPPKMSIYNPFSKSVITIPLHMAVNGNMEWTPAFNIINSSRKPVEVGDHRLDPSQTKYEDYLPPLAWEELTGAPQIPFVTADSERKNPIDQVGPYDVLHGRGGVTNTNPGNVRLRDLVAKFRMAYFAAPKGVKLSLSQLILNYTRSKGGRFLHKHRDKQNRKSFHYYEVGDEKALVKCSQALRDGIQDLVRKSKQNERLALIAAQSNTE
mmetsp:Transcript_34673/g.84102  ORF Transcript_34673/g.84102 Transcript_34673/m.84102 type:complete len:490 (+) Transcript_34673:232-1701(+)